MRFNTLIIALLAFAISPVAAQQSEQRIIGGDTITVNYTPIDQGRSAQNAENSFSRWVNKYVTQDNSDMEYGVNYSLIGGPTYSTSTSLGLTIIGDLTYRTRSTSLKASPSRLEVSGEVSITGFYRVAIDGINHLGTGRHRLSYHIETASQPSKIWGTNYASSCSNSYGEYRSHRHLAWFRYSYAIIRNTYLGIYCDYRYLKASHLDSYATVLLASEAQSISTAGFGVNIAYDSRSSMTDPKRGLYIGAEYIYRPRQLGNIERDLWQTTAQFNFYVPLWKGATLAYDLYGEFRTDNTPWLLRSKLGDAYRMRGYYEGRYNDNNMITTQLELRQQLWDRLGGVVWGGCGVLFATWDKFDSKEILPTYGVGLRWRVRNNSNIRFDVGFGRNCYGFIFGINEAF